MTLRNMVALWHAYRNHRYEGTSVTRFLSCLRTDFIFKPTNLKLFSGHVYTNLVMYSISNSLNNCSTCHELGTCIAFFVFCCGLVQVVCTRPWSLHYWPHNDVIKWKHFSRYWPYVRGIHRSPVNSPHKGQWRGALMFSLICAWVNG